MNNYRLQSQWEIWFAYLSESEEKQAGYGSRLYKAHCLQTTSDLLYLWMQSPIASLRNFFVFPNDQGNCVSSYMIENQYQKINAINFFKKGIEPKWQDPKNEKGGRYLFQVNKDQENFEHIYSALVFYLIGQDYEGNQEVNGFRFISSKFNTNNNFLFRVQIWVNYNEENIDKVVLFRKSFTQFLSNNQIKGLNVLFKNNK